jgi:hypothetical protein
LKRKLTRVATLKICKWAFQAKSEKVDGKERRLPVHPDDLDWDNKDYSGWKIDDFRGLTALTIVHEVKLFFQKKM